MSQTDEDVLREQEENLKASVDRADILGPAWPEISRANLKMREMIIAELAQTPLWHVRPLIHYLLALRVNDFYDQEFRRVLKAGGDAIEELDRIRRHQFRRGRRPRGEEKEEENTE